jgi:hypothetical protein
MDRNPLSDLEAIAASPGLEQLSGVIAQYLNPQNPDISYSLSLLMLLAGRWTFGSANACESAMRTTNLWRDLRESASSVGRRLPEDPPSLSKLHKARRALDATFAADPTGLLRRQFYEELSLAFTQVAVEVAKSVGLLTGERGPSWEHAAPGCTIYGDGSVFAPYSGVTRDPITEEVKNSRATTNSPRVATVFKGKEGSEVGGVPITVVGVHGRERWQRVFLGIDLFADRNEIGSSMKLFRQVIELACGGVTHVVYDRLASGTHLRALMKMGVTPVVPMPEADQRYACLVMPYELQRSGYSSQGAREKRKGKGSRRRSADKVAPKARLRVHHLRTVTHETPRGECHHELWTIDGSLVVIKPDEELTLDATFAPRIREQVRHDFDGFHPIGTHHVPCRSGRLTVEFDYAADRERRGKGNPLAQADWLRVVPETSDRASSIEGLRSDVESVFSWLKEMLPRNRASSHQPDHFFLDVLGAGLLCNAIAWDVYASQHTRCAQHEAEKRQKLALKRDRNS